MSDFEGHLSNENSGKLFAPWRDAPGESPGGGMTGSGLHVLDAFINLAGPVRLVHGRLVSRKPKPDPHDTVSVLLELANGITGTLSTVRATPVLLARACVRAERFGRIAGRKRTHAASIRRQT